jgi:hypothetical protein
MSPTISLPTLKYSEHSSTWEVYHDQASDTKPDRNSFRPGERTLNIASVPLIVHVHNALTVPTGRGTSGSIACHWQKAAGPLSLRPYSTT